MPQGPLRILEALAWFGLSWPVPLLGSLLYALFGINRVPSQAQTLPRPRSRTARTCPMITPSWGCSVPRLG